MLDFFGVPVKAQELLNHLSQMKLLARKLTALEAASQSLPRAFRLDAAGTPPQAKWGRAVGWTPKDDAMLLLGVYWHGMGHWEAIVGDPQLGLAEKLSSVLAPAMSHQGGRHAAGGGGPTPPPDVGGEGAAEGASGGGGAEGAAAAAAKEKEMLPKGVRGFDWLR